MVTLVASKLPEHLLGNIKTWLESSASVNITGAINVAINGEDPPGLQAPRRTTRAVSLSIDFQQPASPVSLYARLLCRCYVVHPDSSNDYDAIYALAGAVAESLRRYAANHTDILSVDVDAGASILFSGSRAYGYQTLLLTVPTTSVG